MSNIRYCQFCGKEILKSTVLCPHCGSALPNFRGKSKTVAALLAIFLGSFGIHKFYLGQSMQGILYLLFCWTGIPGIIAFIEGILYLLMSYEKFYMKYGS